MHGLAMIHAFQLDMIRPRAELGLGCRSLEHSCIRCAGVNTPDTLIRVEANGNFSAGTVNLVKPLRQFTRAGFRHAGALPVLDQQFAAPALIIIERVNARHS